VDRSRQILGHFGTARAATEGMMTGGRHTYLDEAERCSRIALMYEGKIQQCANVKASLGVQRLEVTCP